MAVKAGVASLEQLEFLYKALSDPATREAFAGLAKKLGAESGGLGASLLAGFDELGDDVERRLKTKRQPKTNPGSRDGEFVSPEANKALVNQMDSVRREFKIPDSQRKEFHDYIETLTAHNDGKRLTYKELQQAARDFLND